MLVTKLINRSKTLYDQLLKNRVLFIALSLLFLVSCSTKKNTAFRRGYHNLTAHYNAYFNGRESYKEGVLTLEKSNNDDYNNILNVFLYDDASANSVNSQMQRAIDKAAKVVKRHSITARPKRKAGKMTDKEKKFNAKKEFNNWVDNSHLMMGRSYMYQGDYKTAEESFTWILSEYPESESYYDAQIWLARAYIQTKQFSKALDYLQRSEAEKDFPEKRLNKELFVTYADYYIKQNRFSEALPWLDLAIKEGGKKVYIRRYKYIMAQIYQQLKQDQKASEMYRQVIKLNPPYAMEFSAKIQRATLFDQNTSDSKEIRKYLAKMIKDEKNKDYLDQIYFAIAQIDIKEKLEPDAIGNYKLSAQKSVSNNNQKAQSYLALADIYFKNLDYVNAKCYYDSTMMNLSKKNNRYDEIDKKSDYLSELVGYIQTVEKQDSLLKLALMPEANRNKAIAEVINRILDEEKRKAEEERDRQKNIALYNENNRPGVENNSNSGKWYFYNPVALGMGQSDFTRKWGERRLEDNWRRRNKGVSDFQDLVSNDPSAPSDSAAAKVDLKSKDYYLKQLPLTDSAKVETNLLIERSLFQLAKVYREKFVDYNQSIATYLQLLERYPQTQYQLEAYYDLYQLYQLQKQTEKAQFYKQLILDRYPESVPAKILSDPNYLARMEAEQNKALDVYYKTFRVFENQQFDKVIEMCNFAQANFKDSPVLSKFLLLKAQSIGATGNVDLMKNELQYIAKTYPKSEEQDMADFMLSRIEANGFTNFVAQGHQAYKPVSNNETAQSSSSTTNELLEPVVPKNLYQYQADVPHLYMMVATGQISDINRLKYNILNYNLEHFLMFDFKISDKSLSSDTKLILVQTLNDAKEARKYLKIIQRNQQVYSEFNSVQMQQLIITQSNLDILLKEKDLSRYLMFYNQNYQP